ncbi:translocation/assembly module TamB domain-containing protein [Kerstersia gyiorum]|uniref:translocation/assembly module TamB domain-containing protein n=1 Tax=Kerstersia gyiorum TaxID=206506 RepID=UPI0039ED38FA
MKKRRSFLRRLLWWGLPTVVLLVALATSLVGWVLLTQAGTRAALRMVASQLDGKVEAIEGDIWHGVKIGRLVLSLPGVDVDASDLVLRGEWRFLMEKQVWVRELSASKLSVALSDTGEEEPPKEGPVVVDLPVGIRVDKLALGEFVLTQDGTPLPVTVKGLQASIAAADEAQLRLGNVEIGHDMADAWISGEVRLEKLAEPWPMDVALSVHAKGRGEDSPVCLKALPGRPADAACEAQASLQLHGSLEQLAVALQGNAPGLAMDAKTELALQAAFPLRDAAVALTLADGSSATLNVELDRDAGNAVQRDRLRGELQARRLDLGLLSGGAVPPGVLTMNGSFDVMLRDQSWPEWLDLKLDIADASRWNGQPLSGKVVARAEFPWSEAQQAPDWMQARASGVDIALTLGTDRLSLAGGWGTPQAEMKLDAALSQLANWWPGLPGAVQAKGTVGGTVGAHRARLEANYALGDRKSTTLGEAPVQAKVDLEGGWGSGRGFQPTLTGWRGTLRSLDVSHAGLGAALQRPMDVAFMPDASASQWQWQVGATALRLGLPRRQALELESLGARGGGARWQTAGRINALALNRDWIMSVLSLAEVKDEPEALGLLRNLVLDGAWDLRFDRALGGHVSINRRSGDIALPGGGGKTVGLEALGVTVDLVPGRGHDSQARASLVLGSKLLGGVQADADTTLSARNGVPGLDPEARINAALRTDKLDLSWVNMFAGDAQEVHGELTANLTAQGSLAGPWNLQGGVNGQKLRIVRIDDGIRLLDGTLSLRIENDVVILDSLRFPAVLRVTPPEWRTRTWITEEADAQNGFLNVSGRWRLTDSSGKLQVELHRYPIVQRNDRYAMFSGKIDVEAALPKVDITGKIVADAGWVSADMLSAVPTLDDDVHVMTTQAAPHVESEDGLDMSMDLVVDLGPRFYLTGMGIDSGLTGSLRLMMKNGQLSAAGTLRTRGGRFEAYGQRLQLTRGNITFQGMLDNPLLDIEALRRGETVEAGVKVTGTAQRPRITLVSYPNVSEVEKLSWLILGRGPDQSGNDTALLLAVGASLFSGGTPMYKQLGLDDVGIKSGAMGTAGSLLPDTTVASQASVNDDSVENQFLVASKRFSDGLTLTVEQALSGSGLVARLSYWISRRLSADLRAGEVNGLGLTYRRIYQE